MNKVENYPYPYVIGRLCWEFPCAVPDDWQGQQLHQANNPKTVEDIEAVIDATVIKRGVTNLIFHPYAWIRNDQLADVVNDSVQKHGRRIKFLNFRECLQRLNQHLLAGQPLRAANGQDNGVRILDVDNDGYLDVVIGNEQLQLTRIWDEDTNTWQEAEFPVRLVDVDNDGNRRDAGVRFGILRADGAASFLVVNETASGVWHFDGKAWTHDVTMLRGLKMDGQPLLTTRGGMDQGVRLRDMEGDGRCEVLVSNPLQRAIFRWNDQQATWNLTKAQLPEGTAIVNARGNDAGSRFVDIDQDGHDDVIFSNEQQYSVNLYESPEKGWSLQVRSGRRSDKEAVPMIVRSGTNNGAWFADRHMWLQNEDTDRMPDGIDRRSFDELLGDHEPPPRSPKASLRSIRTRPGFVVELVAAEPLVRDPIGFDWGPDGRLWVVEMADYPLGLDDQGQPGGRVRYLTDTNDDGRFDQSTLFLEGIPFPTSVMAWRDGVLVTSAPHVFYAEDTDGDGRADRRETLFEGFGEGNQQHRVNGLRWGLDNWVYLANGDSGGTITSLKTGQEADIRGRDLRIRPDEGTIDPQSGQTQYGRSRDDWGNWFGCLNPRPLRHFVLADHYLRRNPHVAPPNPRNDIALNIKTQVYPISRVLSHWSGYRYTGVGQPHRFSSACSTEVYRDELFGPAFNDNTFTSEPVYNLIHRRILEPKGVTFTSRRAPDEQHREFLSSTDSWFRPTSLRTGPDGALWVADMYRLVIEHPKWIDDEREKELFLRSGHDKGRIYRVYPHGKSPRPIPRFHRLDTSGLVAALDCPNGWQRDTVQRLLIHRGDLSAIKPLTNLVADHPRAVTRLHALCTLDGLDALTAEVLARAMTDVHPAMRRHAVRLTEKAINESSLLQDKLLRLLSDNNNPIRLQLAYTLGEWNSPRAGEALGRLAQSPAHDPYLLAAVISSINETNLNTVVATVLAGSQAYALPPTLIQKLAVLGIALDQPSALGQTLNVITRSNAHGNYADWQYDALDHVLTKLTTQNETLINLVSAELAAKVERMLQRARQTAADASAELSTRVAAIRSLGSITQEREELVDQLTKLLDPQIDVKLQAAAVAAFSRMDHVEIGEILLQQLDQLSPRIRNQALDSLMSRSSWVEALVRAIEENRFSQAMIDTARRQRLTSHQDDALRQRAKELFSLATDASRQTVLDRYAGVLSQPGDPDQGAELFVKHCASCHRLRDVGHIVGPDLAALKDRSPSAILTAMFDPNRAIEDKYVGYLVVTSDGRTRSGIITNETSSTAFRSRSQRAHDPTPRH